MLMCFLLGIEALTLIEVNLYELRVIEVVVLKRITEKTTRIVLGLVERQPQEEEGINLKSYKMKKTAFTLLFLILFLGCNSQEKENQETQTDKKEKAIIKPKEKWDVKKEYDEFGNLIKYDSIYSYSYSNIEGRYD